MTQRKSPKQSARTEAESDTQQPSAERLVTLTLPASQMKVVVEFLEAEQVPRQQMGDRTEMAN